MAYCKHPFSWTDNYAVLIMYWDKIRFDKLGAILLSASCSSAGFEVFASYYTTCLYLKYRISVWGVLCRYLVLIQ